MAKLKKFFISKPIVTLLWFVALLAIWEICAYDIEKIKRTPQNILPHLSQIIEAIFSDKMVSNKQTALQIVITSAKDTLIRAGIGFLWGILIGFLLALIMNICGVIQKIMMPYLVIIQMIPILGMAPIVLAITHDISLSRIVIAAILTFYPVAINTIAGFKSVEKEKHELMYSYASNKFQLYTKMLIPSAIPYFFTGLKVSAPMAITASILVDTLQGDGGLGCMLSQSLKHAMSIYVFWLIVFFSAIIGILSFYLIGLVEKLISSEFRVKFRKKVKACFQSKAPKNPELQE